MRVAFKTKAFLVIGVCLALAACKSSEERAVEHYERGLELLESGDPKRAMVEFRNTLKMDNAHIEARRQIGTAQLQLGNERGAYRSYLQIVERLPDDLEGRMVLSRLAFASGSWGEFERHGTAAVDLAPDLPEAKAIDIGMRYRTASVEQDMPQRNAILVEAEALSDTLPENTILRQLRIDGYVNNERYGEALTLIEENIAETPDDMALYTAKLELLVRLGDEAQVESELRRMLELFPDEVEPKQMMLRYLTARGRTDDAEDFLRELFANAPEQDKTGALMSLVQFVNTIKGPDDALAELESGLEQNPGNDAWRIVQATLKYDLGRKEEAISELRALVEAENTNMSAEETENAKVALAQILRTEGNEVGARALVEDILATNARAAPALKMQAAWLIDEDKTTEAINALRTALEEDGDDAAAMLLMAQAYDRAGNAELKMDFLSLAADASGNESRYAQAYAAALVNDDRLLQAETVLINSLRAAPGNVDVLTMLGGVYVRLDDIPRAKQVAETLANIDTAQARTTATTLNAEILAREFGNDEAISFLEQAAQSQDGDLAITLNLIRARLQSGRPADALKTAKEAVAKTPDNPSLRNALSLAYAANQQFDAAEAELRGLLETRPQLQGAWLQLARMQAAQGNSAVARATIDEGLAAMPDSPDLLWGKASILQEQGDIDGAIDIYEALYAENSASPIIANNLASLLATYREDEDSLARAQIIARRLKDAEHPALRDTYGWILFRTGNAEEALTYLEPAAAGLPNDPRVQFHLGKAYAALGRTEEAMDVMRNAMVIIGPLGDTALRDEIQAEIDTLGAAPVSE